MMERQFNKLSDTEFDLLVCGGGIYGAWTAYDAALRGLKVAIVDKGDWASGTSSASSKLIHGGLRYLETFDFKLVKKSLAERQMLLQSAPHRVWPLRFGLPVVKNSRLSRPSLAIGLTLYDWLVGCVPKNQKHQYLNKSEFIQHFDGIKKDGLLGGFTYFDAQTDDARFVLELVDGAGMAGAICVNYCELIGFIEENSQIVAAKACDKISGECIQIEAKQVVDTAGRWSSQLRKTQQNYRLSKGIHLLLPKIFNNEALLLTAKSDGRVFFVIPWYGLTLVGTTDSNYQDDIDNLVVTENEINYLLEEVNQALPTCNWTVGDIIGSYAGLRVLRESDTDNPGSISRDWSLETAKNGLMSSIGGKLTSAREDAASIVDAVCQNLGINQSCQTFGKVFPWLADCDYSVLLHTTLAEARKLGIDPECALWLVRRHGKRCADVLTMCQENPQLRRRIKPELPLILADVSYCATHEMVISLEDLLRRRLPLALLTKITPSELDGLAAIAATHLSWDNQKIWQETAHYLAITKPI